jgi:hypothetical protein
MLRGDIGVVAVSEGLDPVIDGPMLPFQDVSNAHTIRSLLKARTMNNAP